MSDRNLVKDLTFFERYSGSSNLTLALVWEYKRDSQRIGWVLKRAAELVGEGVHPREADRLARSEWYTPRDPEPWELD